MKNHINTIKNSEITEKDEKFIETTTESYSPMRNIEEIQKDLPGIRPLHSIGLLKRNIQKKHCDENINIEENSVENINGDFNENINGNFNEKWSFPLKESNHSRFYWKKADVSLISLINEGNHFKNQHNPLEEDINRILKEGTFHEKIQRNNSLLESDEIKTFSHENKKIYDKMFSEIVDSKTRIS